MLKVNDADTSRRTALGICLLAHAVPKILPMFDAEWEHAEGLASEKRARPVAETGAPVACDPCRLGGAIL